MIDALRKIGRLPSSEDATSQIVDELERLLRKMHPPISDAEAIQLVNMLGPDDFYGLAWTMIHLIESSPGWPIHSCLEGEERDSPMFESLRRRIL
jgi:hypothetical protein